MCGGSLRVSGVLSTPERTFEQKAPTAEDPRHPPPGRRAWLLGAISKARKRACPHASPRDVQGKCTSIARAHGIAVGERCKCLPHPDCGCTSFASRAKRAGRSSIEHRKGRAMKAIKMVCATALVSLMATAFAGTSSAIAESTALCDHTPVGEEGEYCPEKHFVTHVHETTVPSEKGVLKTSTLTIECDVLFLGDTSGLGAPLVIEGSFTYSNCTSSCTITEESGPAELEALKEGHETASVTGESLVHVECSGLNCRYNGAGLKGIAKGWWLSSGAGYELGEITISEQSLNKESGLFCPSSSKLSVKITPLIAPMLIYN